MRNGQHGRFTVLRKEQGAGGANERVLQVCDESKETNYHCKRQRSSRAKRIKPNRGAENAKEAC